jgi:KaiC/GvpD/RAD55 family RecA-like ATPase
MSASPRFLTLTDLESRVIEELSSPPFGITLPYWPTLNQYTGGFRGGELSLVTSGTGTGKTTILANIATQLNTMGIGTYIASVEIGPVAFLLAMLSVVSQMDLNTGDKYSPEIVERVKQKWLPLLRAGRLIFGRYDDRVDPTKLAEEIIDANQKFGVKFAILDNLQFFSQVVDAQNERSEQDRVIREFVRVVKRVPVHIFLVVHTRKTNNDNQRVESLSDLKGSKTLVDEAWNVFALNKPPSDEIHRGNASWSDREIVILKMRRRGKHVGKSIRFKFSEGVYAESADGGGRASL